MARDAFFAVKRGRRAMHSGASLFAAAVLALCLCLLAACGAQTVRPTITQDDLRSGSAVETAIEQGITDKTYAWHWRALDIDAEAARASAGLGESERHDEMAEHYRAWLAQEASLDPAVSPQVAANIAGTPCATTAEPGRSSSFRPAIPFTGTRTSRNTPCAAYIFAMSAIASGERREEGSFSSNGSEAIENPHRSRLRLWNSGNRPHKKPNSGKIKKKLIQFGNKRVIY